MAKRLSALKRSNPEAAEREDVQAVAADIDTYADLAALDASDGGQIMRQAILRELGTTVDALAGSYGSATHPELMALCARLEARLGFLRALSRGKTNLELAEEVLKDMTS